MRLGVIALAGASQLGDIAVAGPWIPDYRAAMFIREHAADARVLTWFNWGEYAIWQLGPAGVRVSMDGRRETVYSAGVLARHWEFYRGRENALDYPDEIAADHIWLPVDLPVVNRLRSRGWPIVFESEQSIVFARRSVEQSRPFAAVPPPPSSFPWP